MKNKYEGYTGLADLKDGRTGENINVEDFVSGKHLRDSKESNTDFSEPKEEIPVFKAPAPEQNILPSKYNGKCWDDLYRSNELETIRTQHPGHYDKLRKEKFKTND